jgi:hypothetical protein
MAELSGKVFGEVDLPAHPSVLTDCLVTWNFHQKQRIKDKQRTLLLVLPSFALMYHFIAHCFR